MKKLFKPSNQLFTIGMLPSSYKVSLTYEEQLILFSKKLEELINAFNGLKFEWGKITGNIENQNDLISILNEKAPYSAIPTDLSELSNQITKFVNEEQLEEAISSFGNVFTLKGTVETVQNLPQTGNNVGDVWYVQSESAGYVWINDNETLRWELLGMTVNTSNFLTKDGLLTTLGNSETNTITQKGISDAINLKQDILYSGQNIKTINNQSIIGSGNIQISTQDNYSLTETAIGTWINRKNNL